MVFFKFMDVLVGECEFENSDFYLEGKLLECGYSGISLSPKMKLCLIAEGIYDFWHICKRDICIRIYLSD